MKTYPRREEARKTFAADEKQIDTNKVTDLVRRKELTIHNKNGKIKNE